MYGEQFPFDKDRLPLADSGLSPRLPGNNPPNFLEVVARDKLGRGADWEACIWERLGSHDRRLPNEGYQGCLVSGGVPRILTRGKRKGQPSWSHIPKRDLEQAVVTIAEEDAARRKYENTTGNCSECGGSGASWAGWGVDTGTRYRVCKRCNGTGITPSSASEPAASDEAEEPVRSAEGAEPQP